MNNYKHTVLILGGSGHLGSSIYRELCRYYKTYGTYYSQKEIYATNQAYFKYDIANDDQLIKILQKTKPSIIISALKGDYKQQLQIHKGLANYISVQSHCKLLYLSSNAVFDAKFKFPSYEGDRPDSKTNLGKFKISVEKLLLKTIPAQVAILRLPLVLGVTSPLITQLREAIKNKATFEVYPNRIISVTTADKIAQQIHYLINKNEDGIFHLTSQDVIHHQDLFIEICEKTGGKFPVFKSTFDSNKDGYFAILPKLKSLPKNYQITTSQVIDDCTLSEDITTMRN